MDTAGTSGPSAGVVIDAPSEHEALVVVPTGRIRPTPVLPANGAALTPRMTVVLDQLERVFAEQGFAQLTISDLAAACHCSRRTLYELAPTRDELVLVVVDRMLQRTAGRASEATRGATSYMEAIREFSRSALVGLRHASDAFHRDAASTPSVARHIDRYLEFGVTMLEATIERGIEAGELRPMNVRVVSEVLWASFERIQDPETLRRAGVSFTEAIDELERLFTAAFTHR